MPPASPPAHTNEVLLTGRLAARPEVRELASGDELLHWRLVVDRSEAAIRRGGAKSDTIDCRASSAAVRRAAASWQQGDVVEVSGALERRFFRTAGGTASRCEVAVTRARRAYRQPAA